MKAHPAHLQRDAQNDATSIVDPTDRVPPLSIAGGGLKVAPK
jgi:hypothetical protein